MSNMRPGKVSREGVRTPSSDVAFSEAVKRVQAARGSRAAYARVERSGGFETAVTPELAGFLQRIDTAFLATASADGQPYVQHRGGPPGFIRVVDEHTLGFVDLSGNRQYVSTGNLSENARFCLFLIDYQHARRVKVWGTARVVPATPEWRARLGDAGLRERAEQVMLLDVTAWDANCPQHIPRKVNLADVAEHVAALEERIRALEAENRRLARRRPESEFQASPS